jgi:hypothetical protein
MVFWVVTPCGLVGRYQRLGEHTVSIFRYLPKPPLNAAYFSVVTQQLSYSVVTYRRTMAHYNLDNLVVVVSRALWNSVWSDKDRVLPSRNSFCTCYLLVFYTPYLCFVFRIRKDGVYTTTLNFVCYGTLITALDSIVNIILRNRLHQMFKRAFVSIFQYVYMELNVIFVLVLDLTQHIKRNWSP